MTLILTAICKDGIAFCSDKRSTERFDNGNVRHDDTLKKIYKFANRKIAIGNHGVNKFLGKSWDVFCVDYEKSNRWENKNLNDIVSDFERYIEGYIQKQLEDHYNHNRTCALASGFIFCGKTFLDNQFRVYELFWFYDANGLHVHKQGHGRFIRSGDGQKYLEKYLTVNKIINTNEYWEKLKITMASKKLKEIFDIAISEQQQLKGDIISEKYDLGYLIDQ